MKGHLRKRGKDSWSIVIDIGKDPDTGKRCQKWHTIKGTKRDADRELRQILSTLDKGIYVEPTSMTVTELLRDWLDTYASIHTTLRTQESYRSTIECHLIPILGSVPLAQLKPEHLQKYYKQALTSGRRDGKGGLSARSVLYHHRIVSKALSYALKRGIVGRNVAEIADPPKPARVRINTLTTQNISRLLDAAQDNPQLYVFFSTLLYTGLRRGELLALK